MLLSEMLAFTDPSQEDISKNGLIQVAYHTDGVNYRCRESFANAIP
jgi:hypothetical protein